MQFFGCTVAPTIKEKPKIVKDDKKKTVVMECIVHSDSPPKVKVMKGSETILEDKKHFAKIEQIKEVQELKIAECVGRCTHFYFIFYFLAG